MPPQITAVTTILQLIISGATVVTLVYTLAKFLKAPEVTQNDRLNSLEKRVDKISERLDDGDKHFQYLDEGSTITQQCILAMMDAQISGDNIEELKEKRNRMQEYLTKRGVK